MKRWFSFLLFYFLPLFSSAVQAAPAPFISSLFDCSSEGWSVRRLVAPYSFSLVRLPDLEGCAARFEIRPDENQINEGWRAELRDPLVLEKGSEWQYEFSTYFPKDLAQTGARTIVIAQWHDLKDPGTPEQRPPFAFRLVGNQLLFSLFNQEIFERTGGVGLGEILNRTSISWDRWYRFRVIARWSATQEGAIDVFVNGQQIVRYRGPVGYPTDRFAPYVKIGAYTVHEFKKPIVLFHTNYQRTILREAQ